MEYELRIALDSPYAETVVRVRAALAEQGIGVLTEIDVRATLRDKSGLEMEDYLILGVCNPDLAHQVLQVDRAIGVLLPCNVVVSADNSGSRVRILDPQITAEVTGREELKPISDEASRRLRAVLDALTGTGRPGAPR